MENIAKRESVCGEFNEEVQADNTSAADAFLRCGS